MTRTIAISGLAALCMVFSLLCSVSVAYAQGSAGGGSSGSAGGGMLTNPINSNSVAEFVEKLLRAVVVIGVPIAVLFIVLAGFRFITAQGSPEELKRARANFLHVVIGIAIFIAAWELAVLVLNTMRAAGVQV